MKTPIGGGKHFTCLLTENYNAVSAKDCLYISNECFGSAEGETRSLGDQIRDHTPLLFMCGHLVFILHLHPISNPLYLCQLAEKQVLPCAIQTTWMPLREDFIHVFQANTLQRNHKLLTQLSLLVAQAVTPLSPELKTI